MEQEILRKDENTITVITPTSRDIKYDDLVVQRVQVQSERDTQLAQFDAQLSKIDALLAECEVLNVGPVVEEVPVVEVPVDIPVAN